MTNHLLTTNYYVQAKNDRTKLIVFWFWHFS